MKRHHIREIGLTGLFLLFVGLMYTDVSDFFAQPAKDTQVLAANTKESAKRPTPTPSTKPTPTINQKYYATWTPTPPPSRNETQSVNSTSPVQANTPDTFTSQRETDQPVTETLVPQAEQPLVTPIPPAQRERDDREDFPDPTPFDDRQSRGGILDDVTDILDPNDRLPL
jgi:hypothetical protein